MKSALLSVACLALASAALQPQAVSTAQESEKCEIVSRPEAREATQGWCDTGMYSRVEAGFKGDTFIMLLQLSKKGQAFFDQDKEREFKRYRSSLNVTVQTFKLSAGVSLSDVNGKLIIRCFRNLEQPEVVCNTGDATFR